MELKAAISLAFLVPIFGVFWGAFLLDEIVTPNMLAGVPRSYWPVPR